MKKKPTNRNIIQKIYGASQRKLYPKVRKSNKYGKNNNNDDDNSSNDEKDD